MLKTLGEARKSGGRVGGSTGGEGALVIHLPEDEKCHPGFALVCICRGEVGVTADPGSETSIHGAQIPPQGGAGDCCFGPFHIGSPGSNINVSAGVSVPANHGAVGDGT